MLTADGHVSEGSAENLFIVRDGMLVTPSVTDNILEGITRGRLIAHGRATWGSRSSSASIDRTELYIARGGLPVRHRCAGLRRWSRSTADRSATGRPGPITARCRARTSTRCAAGSTPTADWLTPVY